MANKPGSEEAEMDVSADSEGDFEGSSYSGSGGSEGSDYEESKSAPKKKVTKKAAPKKATTKSPVAKKASPASPAAAASTAKKSSGGRCCKGGSKGNLLKVQPGKECKSEECGAAMKEEKEAKSETKAAAPSKRCAPRKC